MAKLSRQEITPREVGPGTEWSADLDGYTVSMVKVSAETDLTPLLVGLPNDQCPSAHWGYVIAGGMWFRYGDREETIGPGEAYYAPPGHTSGALGDSEFVVFSPTETMAIVQAHMAKRAQEVFGAAR